MRKNLKKQIFILFCAFWATWSVMATTVIAED